MDDDEEMYGPEDLEGDEGTEAIEMGDDELQFDQEDESDVEYDDEESKEGDTMEKLVDTSDSARSQDVLTESIDSSHQQESQEESKVAGSSMEMVDLSKKKATKVFDQGEMKEFKPSGSVNQSQKKRDKRKAKK